MRLRLVGLAGATVLMGLSEATSAGADAADRPSGAPTQGRCAGAASRDAARPCRNPALRTAVRPTPTQAVLEPPPPCEGDTKKVGTLYPCIFGPSADARPTDEVALLGDSHAGHWRAAVRYVAQQRGWRGTSLTRSGCAFSTATRALPEPARSRCRTWNAEVLAWFERHPEVHTIFVSASATLAVEVPQGRSAFEHRVEGYLRAWRSLPASVTRIIVLRDTPKRSLRTLDCIEAGIAARRPVDTACAVPRANVLPPDPQAVATSRARGSRIRLADLSAFFCSSRLCSPVVGGVLVNKDQDHMTTAFSLSLGPFVLRRVERLGPFALRRSLTSDQGKEMAEHAKFTLDSGLQPSSTVTTVRALPFLPRPPPDT
ncbi:MAG: SGNH hydrolase domain-containing protein, partial [Candidatus Limnocylindria bacterium]